MTRQDANSNPQDPPNMKAALTQANLIAYWRATELFAPQPLPKPEDQTRITRLAPSTPLPWHPTHPIREEWLGDKQAWQHVVYCGVYSLDQAFGPIPGPGGTPRRAP